MPKNKENEKKAPDLDKLLASLEERANIALLRKLVISYRDLLVDDNAPTQKLVETKNSIIRLWNKMSKESKEISFLSIKGISV